MRLKDKIVLFVSKRDKQSAATYFVYCGAVSRNEHRNEGALGKIRVNRAVLIG